jgi:hypothetical protein
VRAWLESFFLAVSRYQETGYSVICGATNGGKIFLRTGTALAFSTVG